MIPTFTQTFQSHFSPPSPKRPSKQKRGNNICSRLDKLRPQKNISRLNQQFRPKKERKAYWKEILAPRDSADARFCRTRISRVLARLITKFFSRLRFRQIVVRGIFARLNSLCTGILIAKAFNVDYCSLLACYSAKLRFLRKVSSVAPLNRDGPKRRWRERKKKVQHRMRIKPTTSQIMLSGRLLNLCATTATLFTVIVDGRWNTTRFAGLITNKEFGKGSL